MDNTISVQDLTNIIKNCFKKNLDYNYTVQGEVVDVTDKGHIWFTLKDLNENCVISSVIWRSTKEKYNYQLEVGDIIITYGKFNFYAIQNRYNLQCSRIQKKETLENLLKKKIKKFQDLGYFNKNNILDKKNIKKVALITSFEGEAINDFKKTISNRLFFGDIHLSNVNVQGVNCVSSIIKSIDEFENNVDIILITRGGGSFLDLNEFNNDELIERIYKCSTPVYCAIGHENDYTICDSVCDLKTSTPTSLALEISMEKNILDHKINELLNYENKKYDNINNELNNNFKQLNNDIHKYILNNKPNGFYFNQNYITKLEDFKKICNETFKIKLLDCEIEFKLEDYKVLEKYDKKYTYDKYIKLFENRNKIKVKCDKNINEYLKKFNENNNFGSKNNFIIIKKLLKIIQNNQNELININKIKDCEENYNIEMTKNLENLIIYKKHLNFLKKEIFKNKINIKKKKMYKKFINFMKTPINKGITQKIINDFKNLKNYKIYYY